MAMVIAKKMARCTGESPLGSVSGVGPVSLSVSGAEFGFAYVEMGTKSSLRLYQSRYISRSAYIVLPRNQVRKPFGKNAGLSMNHNAVPAKYALRASTRFSDHSSASVSSAKMALHSTISLFLCADLV